jgi:HAE1 family hydrophobic/amphiphilic exporter-1
MEALSRLAATRPVAVAVFAAAMTILGWIAWGDMPLDLLPDIQSPTIVVSTSSGDRPPVEMERIYGERVEQLLFTVRGIRSVEQVARTGRLIATVTFEWDTDMDLALVDVEKSVGRLRSDPDVSEVLVRRLDPRQAPVLSLGLVAPAGRPDLAELRRLAKRQVSPALERLDGVAEARVLGGREREVQVEVDRYKLQAYGIPLSELESRVRAANIDLNAGTLEEGGKVYLVRGVSRYRTADDVARAVIRYVRDGEGRNVPVRVGDVANVSVGDAEIRHLVRVDGVEGVGLSIYKEAGSNTVAVSRTVREALSGIGDDLPGVEVRIVTDEAALVEQALRDVQQAALIGIALAILVLVLFLRSPGPTVVVATAVPVSLLSTLFLMHLNEGTLNIMTLGGLALGAGMLVDNAIVVVENIFRHLTQGENPVDAAARGTAEVAGAITASTLTTCAVFLPVVFVKGFSARLVSGLSFAVVVSLLASLVVAVFLIPALAQWLLPRKKAKALDPGRSRFERLVARLLKRPLVVVAIGLLLVLGAGWMLRSLGTELLPPADPKQFGVRLVGPPGQRVESTSGMVAAIETVLRDAAGDDLEAVMSEVGRLPEDDRQIREEQSEENTARILVRLAEDGAPARVVADTASRALDRLDGVDLSWEVGASALSRALGTSGPPIVVEISGESLPDLRAASNLVLDALQERPEIWNLNSSFEGGPPELRIVLERSIADGLGIDLNQVAAVLEASLDGRRATVLTVGDEERNVVLKLPRVRRADLVSIPITSSDGVELVLGDVARFIPEEGAREIYRRDQRRVARVTARIAPGYEYPQAIAGVEAALGGVDPAPGLSMAITGEEEERERTFHELTWAALLALLLVFMVLAGTFESLIHPLTIASSVPLALIGVAVILFSLGRPIGVMEMLGMIVLAGVAVNDAILLVDTARRLMSQGLERSAALARAAGLRLRPILMTTATTVLALLPLALGAGESARLRSPMALTVIGGIIASTIACLTVIPCLYLLLDRLRPSGKTG